MEKIIKEYFICDGEDKTSVFIRLLRKNLTIDEFARNIGYSKSYVSMVLSGQRQITNEVIERFKSQGVFLEKNEEIIKPKYEIQKNIKIDFNNDETLTDDIMRFLKKCVVKICDEQEKKVFENIVTDIRTNPDKYDYDFTLITRERIIDLIKKGVEYEKLQ